MVLQDNDLGQKHLKQWFWWATHSRLKSKSIDDTMFQYLSPLGWEHINLMGDYVWQQSRKAEEGQFRLLRMFDNP